MSKTTTPEAPLSFRDQVRRSPFAAKILPIRAEIKRRRLELTDSKAKYEVLAADPTKVDASIDLYTRIAGLEKALENLDVVLKNEIENTIKEMREARGREIQANIAAATKEANKLLASFPAAWDKYNRLMQEAVALHPWILQKLKYQHQTAADIQKAMIEEAGHLNDPQNLRGKAEVEIQNMAKVYEDDDI